MGVDEKLRYHPGVFAIYKALDLPVVPVALNSGVLAQTIIYKESGDNKARDNRSNTARIRA